MQILEKIANTKFDSTLKEKVWKTASETPLNVLKDYLLLLFCDKILCNFEEKELEAMLREDETTGYVRFGRCNIKLKIAYQLNKPEITNLLIKKAVSMTANWIPEIVAAIKKEGVEIPDS